MEREERGKKKKRKNEEGERKNGKRKHGERCYAGKEEEEKTIGMM